MRQVVSGARADSTARLSGYQQAALRGALPRWGANHPGRQVVAAPGETRAVPHPRSRCGQSPQIPRTLYPTLESMQHHRNEELVRLLSEAILWM